MTLHKCKIHKVWHWLLIIIGVIIFIVIVGCALNDSNIYQNLYSNITKKEKTHVETIWLENVNSKRFNYIILKIKIDNKTFYLIQNEKGEFVILPMLSTQQ